MTMLTFRDPFRDFERIQRELWLGLASPASDTSAGCAPAMDVSETAEAVTVRAELPGLKREDIEVLVEDGVLILRGHRKAPDSEEGHKFHRREMAYGRFQRRFRLPREVAPDAIEAKLCEGVLELTLPRREETRPRRIEVKG